MRHADDNLIHAHIAGRIQNRQQAGDHRIAALNAEALHAGIFHLHKFLEAFNFEQRTQNPFFLFRRKLRLATRFFHPRLNPLPLGKVLDVHIFHTHRAAIGLAQLRHDFIERRALTPQIATQVNRPRPIRRREPVGLRLQIIDHPRLLNAQRIKIRQQMPTYAIGANQLLRLERIHRFFLNLRRAHRWRRTRLATCFRIKLRRHRHLRIRLADHPTMELIPRRLMRRGIAEARKKLLPALIHRPRIVQIALVKLLNKRRVSAVKIRSFKEILGHGWPCEKSDAVCPDF